MEKELVATKGQDKIYSFTLTNRHGMIVKIINYGCIITGIYVPDRDGRIDNVVLHYEHIEDYFNDTYYVGAIIGRYANRLSGGSFSIGEDIFQLTVNEASLNNHLHGGFSGFNKKVWDIVSDDDEAEKIILSYHSPHLEEGYPGNLDVQITYVLTDNNELQVIYAAGTDRPTIINLTNHSYFNFSGKNQSILGHEVSIKASKYTPANNHFIPTGDQLPVDGKRYDVRHKAKVADIASLVPTINYCLDNRHNDDMAAELHDPISGRRMHIYTTEPGLQLYFGNFLGKHFLPLSGICLEPQHYPDSPNHQEFPSVILMPEEKYKQVTRYQFDTI